MEEIAAVGAFLQRVLGLGLATLARQHRRECGGHDEGDDARPQRHRCAVDHDLPPEHHAQEVQRARPA